jgi:hypothetical protein
MRGRLGYATAVFNSCVGRVLHPPLVQPRLPITQSDATPRTEWYEVVISLNRRVQDLPYEICRSPGAAFSGTWATALQPQPSCSGIATGSLLASEILKPLGNFLLVFRPCKACLEGLGSVAVVWDKSRPTS